jgi:hypothetical protein
MWQAVNANGELEIKKIEILDLRAAGLGALFQSM